MQAFSTGTLNAAKKFFGEDVRKLNNFNTNQNENRLMSQERDMDYGKNHVKCDKSINEYRDSQNLENRGHERDKRRRDNRNCDYESICRDSRERDNDNRRRESRERELEGRSSSKRNSTRFYEDRNRRRSRSHKREREYECERDNERNTRLRRSYSRNYENDDYDYSKRRRSRSGSYEYRRRDLSRERDRHHHLSRDHRSYDRNSRERESSFSNRLNDSSRVDTSKQDSLQIQKRLDLTQTIQELIQHTNVAKNFATLFCNQSNDSISNDLSKNSNDGVQCKRKRKSRWGGSENDKIFIPGIPTILPSTLDSTQQQAYIVQVQIEEISRRLRTGDLGIPQNPEERSPSPEPIYSSDGKRLNTREFRYRKRLEDQRHQLIQKMQSVNPEFKPPVDYKPPVTRVSDKVLIPQEMYPDINFVGLLIGPRGNTLKAMEKETGAKIIIRGKGSVKEGKVGRKDGQPIPGEDEPLHAFITALNIESVRKAVEKVKEVIQQGIEVPEGHNDLRRMQLRELAQLNGTLREFDIQRCACGSTEHKSWQCPDKPIITNTIVCSACGGTGHLTKDCRSKRECGVGADSVDNAENAQAKIDEEYMSLMAELGEGVTPPIVTKSDPIAQVHMSRGYSFFDRRSTDTIEMQTSSALSISQASTAPTWSPLDMQQGTSSTSLSNVVGVFPFIPNAAAPQPPPPLRTTMAPWMSSLPGDDLVNLSIPGTILPAVPPPPPLPPDTGPPPPPGTTSPTHTHWDSAGGNGYLNYSSWNSGYPVPPPPPSVPPPPDIDSAVQPPPPPSQ